MRLFPLLFTSLFLALPGCGDADAPRSLSFEQLSPPSAGGTTGDAAAVDSAEPDADNTPCAPDDPAAVEIPSLKGEGYEITLENETLSEYDGLVRALEFYDTQKPLIADILVCNGDWENPNITVSLSNHHYSWSYSDPADEPEQGYIVNVHALPSTSALSDRIKKGVRLQGRVRVWGFEVDRINYVNGSYWTDDGCHTLLITHVCID